MFLIDLIRVSWYTRQVYKFECEGLFCKKSKIEDLKKWAKHKFETKKTREVRLAREEEERKQRLKESNERLALLLLCESIGNEDDMNKACDLIKQMKLVDSYK